MKSYLHYPATETETPSPGAILADHYKQAYGYHVYRSKGLPNWTMMYTLEGKGVFQIGSFVHETKPNEFVMIKPMTQQHYATVQDCEWNFVWSYFALQEDLLPLLRLTEAFVGLVVVPVTNPSSQERIRLAFERIITDLNERKPYRQLLSKSAIEEILIVVSQEYSSSQEPPLDSRVKKISDLLFHQFDQPHTIDSLANQVNLSPSRLAHLFKEQTGVSIIETLLSIRIQQSAKLLQFTSLSITEVAQNCGFGNSAYFSTQFASHFGTSPTQFRKDSQIPSRLSK